MMAINLTRRTSILPLVIFRVGFGFLMLGSTIRFAAKGWIRTLYVDPAFHFTYYGFSWIKPLPEPWIYVAFGLLGLSAIGIGLGCFYRASAITFFLLFTYIELIDKAYYLNHYYLVSLLSFLIIWLPLNRWLSVDAWRGGSEQPSADADCAVDPQGEQQWEQQWEQPKYQRPIQSETAPLVSGWTVDLLRAQLVLVYFYAGIAKLQPDWLINAMPMKIWLSARSDLWLVGPVLADPWAPYAMSWGGALYDLTIPFFLLYRPTRRYAFMAVIGFHLLTAILFPQIGMFPYIMIVGSVLFFTGEELTKTAMFVTKPLRRVARVLGIRKPIGPGMAAPSTDSTDQSDRALLPIKRWHPQRLVPILLSIFLLVQLLVPLRHWLYPGNVLWTEEGFRYAWKVMLVEKTGRTTFMVRDPATERSWPIYPDAYLTTVQEAQMAYQPDMILEFAHFLHADMAQRGIPQAEVRAESYVSYNGRPSRLLIDPTVDLSKEQNTLGPKWWIIH